MVPVVYKMGLGFKELLTRVQHPNELLEVFDLIGM